MLRDDRNNRTRSRSEGPMSVPPSETLVLKTMPQDRDHLAATRSLLRLAAIDKEKMDSSFVSDGAFANAEMDANHTGQQGDQSGDTALWGLALEYAAGVALRTHVLQPVISQFPKASQSETTKFLGMNSRGESLLVVRDDGSVEQASMERIREKDGAELTKWWEDDKFLPYTDQGWSDWWVQRCHLFDPGCEMYKLVTCNGETLGVVYFERNIVDNHTFGDKGTVTLIRGMRIAPSLNPQVAHRKNLASGTSRNEIGATYKFIMSILFSHVLYMSVRYGSSAVSVNCPKVLEAERFYQSLMGPPLAFDDSGRRYFRLGSENRWKALRELFHRQVELWLKQLNRRSSTGRRKKRSQK